MSPVAISADRRFHRARVKPSRKRGLVRGVLGPALKNGVLAATAAFVLYKAGTVAVKSSALRIDQILVHGNGRMSSAEVMSALSGLRGENILRVDMDEWRRRLMSSPWVRDATFRRSLPSTVDVVVSEREPLAIGRLRGQLYIVDERGTVIDEYGPQYADFDLPIIDGLSASKEGTDTDEERGSLAARLIQSVRATPDLARRVSQIDVADLHNAAVILEGDSAVIYLGDDHFLQRLESYLGLSAALRERVPDIDYVDLRFDNRIYVRPSGKTVRSAIALPGDGVNARVTRTTATKR